MRILGAVLAGGQSSRFGSPKEEALWEGKPLFDHVADALLPYVGALCVVGRDWPNLVRIDDHPVAGQGPLGGLCGAIGFALEQGFDAVLSSSCDVLGLDGDMLEKLMPGPRVIAELPIIGLWPVGLFPILRDWLLNPVNRSVFGFVDHIGARKVECGGKLRNINNITDLH
jgi:molybdenum cofactor guanylyltransferase